MLRRKQRAVRLWLVERLEDRRLLSAGGLDPNFGIAGKVTTSFLGPAPSVAQSVAIEQPDGKIVVAGQVFLPSGPDFAVARFNSNGSLDPSFGVGGEVTTDFGGFDFASAIALQADGKIVVAGSTSPPSGGEDFALARYNSNGSLDDGGPGDSTPGDHFGVGGKVTTDFSGGFDTASSVAIQADGKIVALGTTSPLFGGEDFALARYNVDGSLDVHFGAGGKVTTDFAGGFDFATSVAIQSDGKIVAAGTTSSPFFGMQDFALARYNVDGSLDDGTLADTTRGDSFGSGGEVTTDFAGGFDFASSMAIQADGKIVVAGTTSPLFGGEDFALARYNVDGSLDDHFGVGGEVTTDFAGGFDTAASVAIQADGKIVALGSTSPPFSGEDFALARYNVDGSLDDHFGVGGEVTTDFGGGFDRATSVAIQSDSDGKIVAAGSTSSRSSPTGSMALARYNVDGSLDDGSRADTTPGDSFGVGGEVTANFVAPVSSGAQSVALQRDGKLIVAGTEFGPSGPDFALARYNVDGSLDTTFGKGGRVTTDFGSFELANSVVVQPNGKIVVAGWTSEFGGQDFALARYNVDGSLDDGSPTDTTPGDSFGVGGKVVTDFGGSDQALAVAIQSDGKIVAAGGETSFFYPSNTDFAMARYNVNGTLDTTFGTGGKVLTTFAPGSSQSARAIAIDQKGQIILVGTATLPGTYPLVSDFALARYNTKGSLDSSFGSGGLVTTDIASGSSDQANAVALQSDGSIVVAGSTVPANPSYGTVFTHFAVVRYKSNGTLDSHFGTGGKVITGFTFGSNDQATAVSIESNGDIVVGGTSRPYNYPFSSTGDFALARYKPNGTLDTSFGTGGLVTTDFASGSDDQANGMVLGGDGSIVLVGSTVTTSGVEEFALARYLNKGKPSR